MKPFGGEAWLEEVGSCRSQLFCFQSVLAAPPPGLVPSAHAPTIYMTLRDIMVRELSQAQKEKHLPDLTYL